MATATAITFGSALYNGFKNEYTTMQHSDKKGLSRLGQGFKSFGKGVVDSFEEGGVKKNTSVALIHDGELIIPKKHVKEVVNQSSKAKQVSKRKTKKVSKAYADKESCSCSKSH